MNRSPLLSLLFGGVLLMVMNFGKGPLLFTSAYSSTDMLMTVSSAHLTNKGTLQSQIALLKVFIVKDYRWNSLIPFEKHNNKQSTWSEVSSYEDSTKEAVTGDPHWGLQVVLEKSKLSQIGHYLFVEWWSKSEAVKEEAFVGGFSFPLPILPLMKSTTLPMLSESIAVIGAFSLSFTPMQLNSTTN